MKLYHDSTVIVENLLFLMVSATLILEKNFTQQNKHAAADSLYVGRLV